MKQILAILALALVLAACSDKVGEWRLYQKNKDLAFETARAHYYKAVGETENDDIVAACEDYLKAAEIMEAVDTESDSAGSNLTANIYKGIGDLFANECCCKQAIENYQIAIGCSNFLNHDEKFCLLRNIGDAYFIDNEYDSALYYYGKALEYCHDIPLKIEISNQVATIFLERDFENTDESVAFFYEKNFEHQNKYTKFECAQRLAAIFDSIGNKERSTFYKNYASDNAIREVNRSAKARELVDFYNNYKHDKQKNLLEKQVLLYSAAAIGIAIIVFVLIFISHKKQKKRLTNEISDKERAAADAKWMLSVTKGKFENARRKISEQEELLKSKELEINDIRHNIGSRSEKISSLQSYYESEICSDILKRIDDIDSKGLKFSELKPLTKDELLKLTTSADVNLNGFGARLLQKYPALDSEDVIYACLQLLNLSEPAITAFLKRSRSTVWSRISKLKKALGVSATDDLLNALNSEL